MNNPDTLPKGKPIPDFVEGTPPVTISQDYLVRVLTSEFWETKVSPIKEEYYVTMKFDGFAISLRINDLAIEVWVQTDCAYVPVSIPHNGRPNAYLSKCIRWVVDKLILELSSKNPT